MAGSALPTTTRARRREPHPREDAGRLDAAGVADERRGAAHVLGPGRVARDPQRHVGLDRRRQVARAAVVRRPRAVRPLVRADPGRGLARGLSRLEAEEMPQEDVLGVDRHVRLELALPPAVRVLQCEQVLGRPRERRLRGIDRTIGGDGHRCAPTGSLRRPGSSSARAARAAVRPLRTAPSIVGGQPVSVQAPARWRPGTAVRGPGRSLCVAGRDAERRPRLVRDGEVEHFGAASGRQQPLERGQIARPQVGDGRADLLDRMGERDRESTVLRGRRPLRSGRRSTGTGESRAAASGSSSTRRL